MVRKLLGARVLAETSVVVVIVVAAAVAVAAVAAAVVVVVVVIIFAAGTITSSAGVITFKVAVTTRTAAVSALVWIISWAARKKLNTKLQGSTCARAMMPGTVTTKGKASQKGKGTVDESALEEGTRIIGVDHEGGGVGQRTQPSSLTRRRRRRSHYRPSPPPPADLDPERCTGGRGGAAEIGDCDTRGRSTPLVARRLAGPGDEGGGVLGWRLPRRLPPALCREDLDGVERRPPPCSAAEEVPSLLLQSSPPWAMAAALAEGRRRLGPSGGEASAKMSTSGASSTNNT